VKSEGISEFAIPGSLEETEGDVLAEATREEEERQAAADAAASAATAAAEAEAATTAVAAAAAAAKATAEAEAWAAYEEAERRAAEEWAASQSEPVRASQDDGKVDAYATEVDDDEWTVHVDEASGYEYRYNTRTGETIWCDYVYDDGNEEEGGNGEEEQDEDEAPARGASHSTSVVSRVGDKVDALPLKEEVVDPGDDDLATARSRLRRVLQNTVDEGSDFGSDAAYTSLVNNTRGDWVEVCDADGSVLGEQLRGKTVYFNKDTYETRMTKPHGWVVSQARAFNKGTAPRRARLAPVHRMGSRTLGRWNSNARGTGKS